MVKQLLFATRIPGHVQPVERPCALCYEGCEGHGSANGLPQPRMELCSSPAGGMLFGVSGLLLLLLLEWNWPKEAMNRPIWAGIVDGAKLF